MQLGVTRDINKGHLWRDTINLSMQRFALNAESVTKYSNQKTPSGGTKKIHKICSDKKMGLVPETIHKK